MAHKVLQELVPFGKAVRFNTMRFMNFLYSIFFCVTLLSCSVDNVPVNLGTAKSCDAAESTCTLDSGKYQLTLKLGPGVKPLKPFDTTLKVASNNGTIDDVIMDFRMLNMDMGMNRYRLKKSNTGWDGNVTLPVCIASRTDWLAVVEFMDDGKRYVASFPFHTDAN
jgi:hypothetical protein